MFLGSLPECPDAKGDRMTTTSPNTFGHTALRALDAMTLDVEHLKGGPVTFDPMAEATMPSGVEPKDGGAATAGEAAAAGATVGAMTAGAECNICFEDLDEDPGCLHAAKPCRIFTCCGACAVAFLARARASLAEGGPRTECPGGCGQSLARADFQRHLGVLPGDKVSVRWRRGKGFFSATVTRVNPDGTFRVLFDDGDVENGVEKDMIRAPAA